MKCAGCKREKVRHDIFRTYNKKKYCMRCYDEIISTTPVYKVVCKDCGKKFEVKKLEPLTYKTDMLLLLDFRQHYWSQWVKFCKDNGYEAEVRGE